MALTQDQSELLNTAIDNLNKSVEVNKEVLEIVKSVGNTGAVDIGEHNNNLDAHSTGFNNLIAKNNLYVGPNGASASDESLSGGVNLYCFQSTSQGFLSSRESLNGCWGNSGATQATASIFATGYNQDLSESFANKSVFGIQAQVKFKSGESVETKSTANFRIGFNADSAPVFALALNNAEYVTAHSYHFEYDRLDSANGSDLGSSTYQWKDCYLQNSPIVSSDERLKQDIEEVPEAVFKAWARVNFKQYRFKEAVASKGDEARKHVGLIAQHILTAFEAEGLDATDYGIVCHDSWDDQYEYETVTDQEAVLDEKGNVVTPEKSHTEKRFVKAAGDVWTVRYEEALALETAYQRWRLSKIEAALEAKGITL